MHELYFASDILCIHYEGNISYALKSFMHIANPIMSLEQKSVCKLNF